MSNTTALDLLAHYMLNCTFNDLICNVREDRSPCYLGSY